MIDSDAKTQKGRFMTQQWKKWSWVSAGLAAVVVLSGCVMVGVTAGLEEPSYTVRETLGADIEVRDYAPRTYAESRVPMIDPNSDDTPRTEAFRLLFNYIAGDNEGDTKIDMTVPVATENPGTKIEMTVPVATTSSNDQYIMRFFLPSAFNAESAPKPTHPSVRIGTLPAQTEAVLTYSGTQSDEKADVMKGQLLERLQMAGWKPIGAPRAMFYNPPFSIPFLRKNEVMVTVTRP